MRNIFFLLVSLLLIGNFTVLMIYGDTIRIADLFIVNSIVFYLIASVNLILGVIMLATTIRNMKLKKLV
jgi:hypothetical protein